MTPPIPAEVLAFFRGKKLQPGFDYRDVWKEEHDAAFTVAKVTELDILKDIQDSLEAGIAGGQTFDQWRSALRATLAGKGWWQDREVIDKSTGEIGRVDLSAPRRLRTIFDTNMRMAASAGQWDRAERTKAQLPYMLRTVGPSREHRPDHLAWHGTLLPIDDPWVQSHPAPCGWGCKCIYRQVGRSEYATLVKDGVPTPGKPVVDPATGLPTGQRSRSRAPAITQAPAEDLVAWRNKRTGKTEMIPRGVDPGFNYPPGQSGRSARLAAVLRDRLATAPAPLAKVMRARRPTEPSSKPPRQG